MVNFQLSLERNQYAAGETAKGTLIISSDKNFKVQGFEFSVSGEERIEIKIDQSYGPSTGYNIPTISPSATSTYKESDIFYSKDLSQFLKSIGTKIEVKEDNDNNTTLEVAGGIWKG